MPFAIKRGATLGGFFALFAAPALAIDCEAARVYHDRVQTACEDGNAQACDVLPAYVQQLSQCLSDAAAVPVTVDPKPPRTEPEEKDVIIVAGRVYADCTAARAFLNGTNATSDFDRALAYQKGRLARGVQGRMRDLIQDLDQEQKIHAQRRDKARAKQKSDVMQILIIEGAFAVLGSKLEGFVSDPVFGSAVEREALKFLLSQKVDFAKSVARNSASGNTTNIQELMAGRLEFALSALDKLKVQKIPGISTYANVLKAGLVGIDVASAWGNAQIDVMFEESSRKEAHIAELKAQLTTPAVLIRELEDVRAGIHRKCPT